MQQKRNHHKPFQNKKERRERMEEKKQRTTKRKQKGKNIRAAFFASRYKFFLKRLSLCWLGGFPQQQQQDDKGRRLRSELKIKTHKTHTHDLGRNFLLLYFTKRTRKKSNRVAFCGIFFCVVEFFFY